MHELGAKLDEQERLAAEEAKRKAEEAANGGPLKPEKKGRKRGEKEKEEQEVQVVAPEKVIY